MNMTKLGVHGEQGYKRDTRCTFMCKVKMLHV